MTLLENINLLSLLVVLITLTVIVGLAYLKKKRTSHINPSHPQTPRQEPSPQERFVKDFGPEKRWWEHPETPSPQTDNPTAHKSSVEANIEKSEFEKGLINTVELVNVLNRHSDEQYAVKVRCVDGRTTGALKHEGMYYILEIKPKQRETEAPIPETPDDDDQIPGEQVSKVD